MQTVSNIVATPILRDPPKTALDPCPQSALADFLFTLLNTPLESVEDYNK